MLGCSLNYIVRSCLKKENIRAGEMVKSILGALTEDLGSVPSTSMEVHNHL